MNKQCNSWKTDEEHNPTHVWTDEEIEMIADFMEGKPRVSFVRSSLESWNEKARENAYNRAMKAIR